MASTPKNDTYWRERFSVTEEEELAVQSHFEEVGTPLRVSDVARFLVQQSLAEDASLNAGIYSPDARYEEGQKLTFPALQGAVGEVVGVRPGANPRHGTFEVIAVRFTNQNGTREFVAGAPEIRLQNSAALAAQPLTEAEIFARHGDVIEDTVLAALEDSGEYVQSADEWLPRALMVDFHRGHLNIAEAMIEMVGSPLTTDELLPEMELDGRATDAIKRFSLNYALGQDERFQNVESVAAPKWDLRR